MKDDEKQSTQEDRYAKKLAIDQERQLARYQAIRKADQIREEKILKTSKLKEIKRTEKLVIDDIKQSARYQKIMRIDLAREQAIARAQETKLKTKKLPPKND